MIIKETHVQPTITAPRASGRLKSICASSIHRSESKLKYRKPLRNKLRQLSCRQFLAVFVLCFVSSWLLQKSTAILEQRVIRRILASLTITKRQTIDRKESELRLVNPEKNNDRTNASLPSQHGSAQELRTGDDVLRARFPLMNGSIFNVPSDVNRYHVPWYVPLNNFKLLNLREANYRILYSPVRHAMSDGIGHSMAILNYEVRTAHKLRLAYSHRVSVYSSLNAESLSAVEDFFGWGDDVPITRAELQKHVCIPEGGFKEGWASEKISRKGQCNICQTLQHPNKYAIKHIVELPVYIAHQCVNKTRTHQVCDHDVRNFLAKNNNSHILFQLPTEGCSSPKSDSTFGLTKNYFWHKYWKRHGFSKERRVASRIINISESSLNIAVHVRRGDFIADADVRNKRTVIPDETYAELVARALQVVTSEGGIFSRMPFVVNIFSEGMIHDKGVLSSHEVKSQDKLYYDSAGVPRSASWWVDKIKFAARRQLDEKAHEFGGLLWSTESAMEATLEKVKVRLRISEPTLDSMHDMVSADIFIGSKSGLSTHAVWALARGVSLMPHGMPIASEGLFTGPAKERVCCTVGYDPKTLNFNVKALRVYWNAYAQANSPSAQRAVSRAY